MVNRETLLHRPLSVLFALLVLALGGAAEAQAKKKPTLAQQKEATSQFSNCREMEREGDATPCWTVWLRKHREAGTEAEVAYADEHARKVEDGGSKVRKKPDDGDKTVPDSKATPPAVVKKDENAEPTNDKPDAKEKTETKDDSGNDQAASPVAAGAVLDFCAMKTKEETTKFVKKRVVLFAPSGAESVESDPAVRKARGARAVRDVFAARFPLDRFHNVISSRSGSAQWAAATSLAVDDVRTFLGGDAKDSDAPDPGAEAKFVAYSVACADYLAVPAITSSKVEWSEQKVKTKKGEQKIKVVSIKLEGSLGIFKRTGARFERVALLDASVPGLVDMATDATAGSIPDVQMPNLGGVGKKASEVLHLPSFMSAIPDSTCKLDAVGKDGVAGLASCNNQGTALGEFAVGKIDERAGAVCKKAQAVGTPDALLQCEVRVRAFQLARALQKQSRSVEGWKLFATLAKGPDDSEDHGVALGKEEGLRMGYGMQVLGPGNERLAYFKVTSVGPGGEAGETKTSALALRIGEAEKGSRVEEYPQLGIQLTPYGTFALLTYNYGTSSIAKGGKTVAYGLPGTVFGGGANVGYDLSSLIGWNETYVRVGGAYLTGGGVGTKIALIPIELVLEKGFYLGSRLTFATILGGRYTSVSVQAAELGGVAAQDLSATVYGPLAKLALDVLLHPDAALRLEVAGAIPLNTANYEAKDGSPVLADWTRRSDHYATVGVNLAFGWTF